MNWLIRFFRNLVERDPLKLDRLSRRKPKPDEPEPTVSEGLRRIEEERAPRGDIIGRQGGQKRNRTHIYRQPIGYPIRLCDWTAQVIDSIERIGECQGTVGGSADSEALVMALEWAEVTKKVVICKHCRAIVQGKRGTIVGGPGDVSSYHRDETGQSG